jgi:hypothetical protein
MAINPAILVEANMEENKDLQQTNEWTTSD